MLTATTYANSPSVRGVRCDTEADNLYDTPDDELTSHSFTAATFLNTPTSPGGHDESSHETEIGTFSDHTGKGGSSTLIDGRVVRSGEIRKNAPVCPRKGDSRTQRQARTPYPPVLEMVPSAAATAQQPASESTERMKDDLTPEPRTRKCSRRAATKEEAAERIKAHRSSSSSASHHDTRQDSLPSTSPAQQGSPATTSARGAAARSKPGKAQPGRAPNRQLVAASKQAKEQKKGNRHLRVRSMDRPRANGPVPGHDQHRELLYTPGIPNTSRGYVTHTVRNGDYPITRNLRELSGPNAGWPNPN